MSTRNAHRKPSGPRISCVMPAYNEAANLARLVPEVLAVLTQLSPDVELLIVDDGSRDDTAAVAENLCHQHAQLGLIQLSRNFGKEAALAAGLQAAAGDVVVLMDADGQHPPKLIADMFRMWRDEQVDDVYTVRRSRADQPALYSLGVRLFYRIVNWGSRFAVPHDASDFRLLDRRVVDVLNAMPERYRFTKGLYAWAGFKSVALPYDPLPRQAGSSHYNLRASLRLGATGLLSFTAAPLRLFGLLGLLLATASLIYGLWVVLERLIWGTQVPGYPTLAAGIMFLSGVQLLSIGLLAEYVARIYDEVKGRPLYWIARRVGGGFESRTPDEPAKTEPSPAEP